MRDSLGVRRKPVRNDDWEARLGTLRAVKADNSREEMGANKNAGLKPGMINKRESRSRSLTLNETCQNPDGTSKLLAP
jgi:hypothetical protein